MTTYYLTIDDGPSDDTLCKLALLEKHNIKAIWFCLGSNLEQHSDAAVALIQAGHIIGNHSYDHPYFSSISTEDAAKQIQRTEDVIDGLYVRAGRPRPAKLFRFPYGDQGNFAGESPSRDPKQLEHREQLRQLLHTMGFVGLPVAEVEYTGAYINLPDERDWLWSYDMQDWAVGNPDGYQISRNTAIRNLDRYLQKPKGKRISVILTHDHERNAGLFAEFVRLFVQRNMTFNLPR